MSIIRPLILPLGSAVGGGGGAIPGIDADAVAWALAVQAAGGSYNAVTLAAMSNFCVSAKAAGIWTKLNRVNLLCGNQLAAALIPLKAGSGTATETNVNFVGGDYTEATGLTGNGTTKYLNTGLAQNVFTAASRHLMAYERVRATGTADTSIGSDTTSNVNMWGLRTTAGVAADTQYSASVTSAGPTLVAAGVGMFVGNSESDTTADLYKNGAIAATLAVAAATPSAEALFVLGNNRSGAVAGASNATLAGYSAGLGLTAAEVATYYTIMQAFQTALGRQV